MIEIPLAGGSRTEVIRAGGIVLRKTGPWASSVHSLLRHLEVEEFSGAPRVVGSGFDESGYEVLTYIEGDFVHPAPWSEEAVVAVGHLLKSFHDATSNFTPPINSIWRPWFARGLQYSKMIIGHCDFAPWNLVSQNNIPFAVIDWETAGPVDALVELAHVCWLNVQLCDDDVAERIGLSSPEARAKQLRRLVDAYGLPSHERLRLVDIMIKVATLDAADQAIEARVTFETKDTEALWGLAWRTRAAAWMIRNTHILNKALI